MKILNSLRSGFVRSGKIWKGILIVWLISLLLVSLVALPMKSAFSTGLGNSMISEKLKDGINVEVFADLSANFRSLGSYFSKGLITIFLVSLVVNSFLAGGLFGSLRRNSEIFSAQEFFRISAKKFWSFLFITLIISVVIIILSVLIIVIPVSLISLNEKASEVIVFNSAILLASLFLFVLIILIISADYARAWQTSHDVNACFKAISFGIKETFRTFYSSYPVMLIIIIVQIFYMWMVFKILPGIKPQSGIGIIILFSTSQILFIIKLFLKTIRYGSITALMEFNTPAEKAKAIPPVATGQEMMYEL